MLRRLAPLVLLLGCTHHAKAPRPVVGAALDAASLRIAVLHSAADVDAAHLAPQLASFHGAGQSAEVKPLSDDETSKLLATWKEVAGQVPAPLWSGLSAARGHAIVELRWSPSDPKGLPAAYALGQQLAAAPGSWTLDTDQMRLVLSDRWKALAADAALMPPRASLHFVNQMYRGDDDLITLETAGTERFGLRPIRIQHASRSVTPSLGGLVNALVQRWVEGERPGPDGRFELNLTQIANAEVRKQVIGSELGKSKQRVLVRLVSDDDPDGPELRLEFPEHADASGDVQYQLAIDDLFGARDSAQNVEHDPRLLEVSRAARERAIREVKPRVQKGLPPDEIVLVKGPFRCDQGTEWMWVEAQTWNGSTVRGPLQSEPSCAKELHAGELVDVREQDIFDFMDKLPDDSFIGNDTGKLMKPELFEELDGGRRRIREQ